MNTNTMLKAIKEIIKLYPSENLDEDKYREELMETIKRIYDTDNIESEVLMYLAEWDWYVYPLDCRDYVLTRNKDRWIIKVNVSLQWWKAPYNIVLEFNDNYYIRNILNAIREYDKSEMQNQF